MSVGPDNTCALREDGTTWCRGDYWLPRAVPEHERLAAISNGYEHVCGLRSDGSPVCWSEVEEDGRAHPPSTERFTAVSSGGKHTCGLQERWDDSMLGGQHLRTVIASRTTSVVALW